MPGLHLQQHVPVHVPELDSTQEARSVAEINTFRVLSPSGLELHHLSL